MKRKRETAGTREINTLNPYAFFGDYYACVFGTSLSLGLNLKKKVIMSKWNSYFFFLKFYYLILNSCFVLLFFTWTKIVFVFK